MSLGTLGATGTAMVASSVIAGGASIGAAAMSRGVGGAGGINQKASNQLISNYEKQAGAATSAYQGASTDAARAFSGSTGRALTNFNKGSGSALRDYGTGSAFALDDFASRTRGLGDSFVSKIDNLWRDPVGEFMLPAAEKALAANEANLGRYAQIAGSLSRADQDIRLAMLDRAAPTWRDERDQAAKVNASLLKGEVPPDVRQALARSGAATALQGGFGGSGMSRNMGARDLGLTSLDLMQQGQGNSQSWQDLMYRIAVPQQTSASSMMEFGGLSGRDAAAGAITGLNARTNAQGQALDSTVRAESALLGGRMNQQGTILDGQMSRYGAGLETNVATASNIFGAANDTARNIFSSRLGVAESATNARLGLGVRAADDAQARANFGAQQAAQTANTISTTTGAIAGTIKDAYANRATVTNAADYNLPGLGGMSAANTPVRPATAA